MTKIGVKGKAEDQDGDLEKVEVKIGNGNWEIATGKTDWSYKIDTTNYDDGTYKIYTRAYDRNEYSDIAIIELRFENVEEQINQKPTIKIIEPEDSSVVKGTIKIKGNAEDKDGNDKIEKIEVKIEDGEWKNAEFSILSSGVEWSYEIDTTKYENGKYTIYVRVYDGIDYSDVISIELELKNYENIAPEILFFKLNSNTYKIGDELSFNGEIEDKNGNDDIIKISVEIFIIENGVPKKLKEFGMGSLIISPAGNEKWTFEKSISLENYKEGKYSIVLQIEDTKGEKDSKTIEFIVIGTESSKEDDFNIIWTIPPIGIILAVIFGLLALKKKKKEEYEEMECPKCGNETEYVKKYDDYDDYENEEEVKE